MKSFIILSCLVAAVIGETYTTDYDNFNYKEVLENPKLLENYLNCLKNKGPCTAEGKKLKEIIPDALLTECSKCNDKQKEIAAEVIDHLIEHHVKDWIELCDIYDPSGEYRKKYEAEAEKRGIKLPK